MSHANTAAKDPQLAALEKSLLEDVEEESTPVDVEAFFANLWGADWKTAKVPQVLLSACS